MTARTPPAGWALELPDLLSRLRAVPIVALAPPDDALLRALIVKLCLDRQLSVDECARDLHRQPHRALVCGRAQGGCVARCRGAAAAAACDTGARGGTIPRPRSLTP